MFAKFKYEIKYMGLDLVVISAGLFKMKVQAQHNTVSWSILFITFHIRRTDYKHIKNVNHQNN